MRSLSVKSPDSAGKAVVVYNSRIAQGKQIFENDGLKLLSLAAGEIGLQYRKKSWL
ncbi:MAG: hypothetical protein ACJ705_01355 [Nitrososphaeraceae archaeon]